ncbi:MAG: symmetrical bis(5'-nucleosyl)-tetraphosphatase [Nitrospira sp.]|nr:symmetrical bis(5'-nucleosyl)-tetraphosphatase [Nitrospira sp.]
MATYAIGDVQGCRAQLSQLVDRIDFNPTRDHLWFVGDLVNRGPDSLGVLRLIKNLGAAASVVLGNHDLFLLAAAESIVTLRPKDTIDDVLKADDRSELIDWLRGRPLLIHDDSVLMVHAGLLPQWTAAEAVQLAGEVDGALGGPDYREFLRDFFHASLPSWHPSLTGRMRRASVARAMTRIRSCTPAGEMSGFSGAPQDVPPGYLPWFRVPGRRSADTTIVTGHWAALGLQLESNHLAIDSGCVWGRHLTAVRFEDRAVFQVEGPRPRR